MHIHWPLPARTVLLTVLPKVMAHAREEYLFQYVICLFRGELALANGQPTRYSVYVLESSTSSRLTYFMPPLVSLYCLAFRSLADLLKR
jgi:hypothetical protein